jgi:hypothetical protein
LLLQPQDDEDIRPWPQAGLKPADYKIDRWKTKIQGCDG